ncbi:MAG: hypothetical protein Q7V57_03935 [Actinomycetota bacterium]|nr:hypothetical protein [Actinomycetota bacterium]
MFGTANTASAQIDGECSASGAWQDNGLKVDAQTVGDDVITIPRTDTVNWEGSVSSPPGEYSGSIWLELPPPFGKLKIDDWSGNGDSTSNSGSKEYDIPKLVPAGVEFEVAGEHFADNGDCTGYVKLVIDGGLFDSFVSIIFFVLTALFGVLFALVVWKMLVNAGFFARSAL